MLVWYQNWCFSVSCDLWSTHAYASANINSIDWENHSLDVQQNCSTPHPISMTRYFRRLLSPKVLCCAATPVLENLCQDVFSLLQRAMSGTLSSTNVQYHFLSIQFVISLFLLNLTEISTEVCSLCTAFYFWVCFLFCFILFPGAF